MAAIVGEVFERETLHLPGNFRSYLDIEHATPLLEKLVELGIAVFSVIGQSIAGETRVVQIGLIAEPVVDDLHLHCSHPYDLTKGVEGVGGEGLSFDLQDFRHGSVPFFQQ
jgi:hypothetical protein